jgi:hypothetical protein
MLLRRKVHIALLVVEVIVRWFRLVSARFLPVVEFAEFSLLRQEMGTIRVRTTRTLNGRPGAKKYEIGVYPVPMALRALKTM